MGVKAEMVNFPEIEKKWQALWDEARVFEVKPEDRRKFFICFPYPYVSGLLHIGQCRVATYTDVLARFHRMLGENTLFPLGFHVSGTPVLGISLGIRENDPKTVSTYTEYVRRYVEDPAGVTRIVRSFSDPEKVIAFFLPRAREDFRTLGVSVDWRRSFQSNDPEHQALVEWQFRKYAQKHSIVQGRYPILFSRTLNNAVGEDDVKDGDTNPVEIQEFCAIKFGFGDSFLLAATLRPETMYGQTNMWVNPDVEYVETEVAGEKWIVSQPCAEKLAYQGIPNTVQRRVKGTDLLGRKCFAPFVEREIPILPSAHCDPTVATGIVTSVPSDAPFDYMALKELQDSPELSARFGLDYDEIRHLEPIPIIRSSGFGEMAAAEAVRKFKITSPDQRDALAEATKEVYKVGFHTGIMTANCGSYVNLPVAQAKEQMRERLLEDHRAILFHETSRPAVSRDGGEVIVAVLDGQWFLDFNAPGWKEKAFECLGQCDVRPEKFRRQLEQMFRWLDKRPCARTRGLGTPLPMDPRWMIESLSDSTIYMALYPITYLLRANNIRKEQLTDAFFDYTMNSEGSITEVSRSTGIDPVLLRRIHEEWMYWYPFDHRHDFQPHISNHTSFMFFAHSAIFAPRNWPRALSFHGLILSEGEKMSKSKGNVISFGDVIRKYGADPIRALLCNAASVESDLDFTVDKVTSIQKQITSIYRTLSDMLENHEDGRRYMKYPVFVSKIERAVLRATRAIADLRLKEYSTIVLYEIPSIYGKTVTGADREDIPSINSYLSGKWIRMLCPMIPHFSEELWARAGGKGLASLAGWPAADESLIDEKLEHTEDLIDTLREDILHIKGLLKMQRVSSVKVFVAPAWKWRALAIIRSACMEHPDMKAIMKALMQDPEMKGHARELPPFVKMAISRLGEIQWIEEFDELGVLSGARPRLEQEFGSVEILPAEGSGEPRAGMAFPGRPALLLA
jgi:leucyl-tRNA synthetase